MNKKHNASVVFCHFLTFLVFKDSFNVFVCKKEILGNVVENRTSTPWIKEFTAYRIANTRLKNYSCALISKRQAHFTTKFANNEETIKVSNGASYGLRSKWEKDEKKEI